MARETPCHTAVQASILFPDAMPYIQIENFNLGLDKRKSPVTAPPGSLQTLVNAHVTPGGELEKRLSFVDSGYDMSDTFGLAETLDVLYVFGTATEPATFPGDGPKDPLTGDPDPTIGSLDIVYQQLVNSPGGVLESVESWDLFEGKMYVVGFFTELGDGVVNPDWTGQTYQHFYDGEYVVSEGATSRAIRTYKTRIYGVDGTLLRFCALGNPNAWEEIVTNLPNPGDIDLTTIGAGFIDVSTEDADMKELVGLEVYYNSLALFSKFSVILYAVDPDPDSFQQQQIVRNSGTVAAETIVQYGAGDVIYLSSSGIRSLRAKDLNNNAAVNDIGSPIDALIIAALLGQVQSGIDTGTEAVRANLSFVNPVSGRLWVVIEDVAYILSYYANSKITAWSTYNVGFKICHQVMSSSRICLRDRDDDSKLYLYGGFDRESYDIDEVNITLPMADANDPAMFKMLSGVDATLTGTWAVEVNMLPESPDVFEDIGSLSATTYAKRAVGAVGYSTHFALRFTNKAAERATLANAVIHYQPAETS